MAHTFKKVTSVHNADGLTYTAVDYIADDHLLAYVLKQNSGGWTVTATDADDRHPDADRTYNPPADITGA